MVFYNKKIIKDSFLDLLFALGIIAAAALIGLLIIIIMTVFFI